ncbi:MAG: hypothetical protein GQ527_01660 [Bacteroidales bacterium]|nr:hypothetical protein [Bacteroidales bacterium]
MISLLIVVLLSCVLTIIGTGLYQKVSSFGLYFIITVWLLPIYGEITGYSYIGVGLGIIVIFLAPFAWSYLFGWKELANSIKLGRHYEE